MLQALDKREPDKVHRYVEIENAGHCPNHEAPQAVAHVVRAWTKNNDRKRENLSLIDENRIIFKEEWGETAAAERGIDDIKLSAIDKLATTFV
jgi:hypothetical protein